MSRRDAANTDAYLDAPRRESESDLYCPHDDVPSGECIDPDAHAASWITYREKARSELADYLYDRD